MSRNRYDLLREILVYVLLLAALAFGWARSAEGQECGEYVSRLIQGTPALQGEDCATVVEWAEAGMGLPEVDSVVALDSVSLSATDSGDACFPDNQGGTGVGYPIPCPDWRRYYCSESGGEPLCERPEWADCAPPCPGAWQGHYAEFYFLNRLALENWYDDQPAAHREQWSRDPSLAEMEWLATFENRRSGFYHEYWWQEGQGGTEENAILVTPDLYDRWDSILKLISGEWGHEIRSGMNSVRHQVWGWPWYIDVQLPAGHEFWEWQGAGAEPPPEPEPDPDPEPTECSYPGCNAWATRYQQEAFDWMRERDWSADRACVWVEGNAENLWRWIKERCEQVEPPEPEPTTRVITIEITIPSDRSTGQATVRVVEDEEE